MNVGFRIPSKVDTDLLERTFDLRQYFNFVWRNWLFIASTTAFAVLIGVVYLARATPRYTASTQVLLDQREKPPGLEVSDGGVDNLYMENQLAILRSDSLLRRVVIKERLAISQSDAKEPQSAELSKEMSIAAEEQPILNAINSLRGALAISRSGEAQVLNISTT
jgi:polysaccharide biosynthesis transport protein